MQLCRKHINQAKESVRPHMVFLFVLKHLQDAQSLKTAAVKGAQSFLCNTINEKQIPQPFQDCGICL